MRVQNCSEARRDWFWRSRVVVAMDVDSALRDFIKREANLLRVRRWAPFGAATCDSAVRKRREARAAVDCRSSQRPWLKSLMPGTPGACSCGMRQLFVARLRRYGAIPDFSRCNDIMQRRSDVIRRLRRGAEQAHEAAQLTRELDGAMQGGWSCGRTFRVNGLCIPVRCNVFRTGRS